MTTQTPTHTGTLAELIATARAQLGYVEVPNNRTVFGAWFGLNGQPWCAMFLSWCAWTAGVPVARFAYCPAGAAWFQARGRWGRTPQLGAFVFYAWPGLEGGRISHVGLVTAVYSDGTFDAIEGNTTANASSTNAQQRNGGMVAQKHRSTQYVAGFGYPLYAVPPVSAPLAIPTPTIPQREPATVRLPDISRSSATHEQTQTVQALLNARGASPALALDGVWGTATDTALGQLQAAHGLVRDVIVGGQTWPLLLGIAG